MVTKSGLFCVIVLLTAACGQQPGHFPGSHRNDQRHNQSSLKERWNSANDPVRMLPDDYEYKFASLPVDGQLDVEPWADTYWPSSRGGLAYRWMDHEEGHSYAAVTPSKAQTLTPAEIAKLSPAEKFDIFVGDENMSLLENEKNRTNPSDGAWFGICHGWAPASMAFKEPKAIFLKGPSGIEIPFGSTDIKGLLSLYSADYANVSSKFLASRCNKDLSRDPTAANDPECRDVNAGAFHLVLTNLIGRKKEGFVADVTRDLEVWNQPVSGFKSRVIKESIGRSPGAALLTVKEIEIETEMHYGREIHQQWESSGSSMATKRYHYRVELNLMGEIIGGEWMDEDRPDFLWQNSVPSFVATSRGGYSNEIQWQHLEQIYNASISASEDAPNPVGH
jgi:hypothetical protein